MERNRANQLTEIGILLIVLYAIHLVSVVTGGWPIRYGLVPRNIVGLRGIIFGPMLHGSWSHLFANTAPLAVMLCLLAFSKRHLLWPTTIAIWVLTGIAVWILGRPNSIQIGASGVIFGLAAYLITSAWLTHHLRSALAALAVLFFYSSIVWGLLPGTPGVSWEGHLSGAIAGFIVAQLSGKRSRHLH